MADYEFDSGFEKLSAALRQAEVLFRPLASKAIAKSLQFIYEVISPYPSQPDRMRSGKLNTYVRGIGWFPKSSFVEDPKEPGGFRQLPTKRAQVRMTSQQLDKKFRMKTTVNKDGVEGELRNDATYSGYVLGPVEGDPHQAKYHAETGWVNEDEAMAQATPVIVENLNTAVDELLKAIVSA